MHLIQVTFADHNAEPEGIYEPPVTDYFLRVELWPLRHGACGREPDSRRAIQCQELGETPSRQRILSCKPSAASDEEACAQRIPLDDHPSRVSPPVTDGDAQRGDGLLSDRAAVEAPSRMASKSALQRIPGRSGIPLPHRARSCASRAGHALSHQ
jgi:hypothetical protein